jgi:hypothetical protein
MMRAHLYELAEMIVAARSLPVTRRQIANAKATKKTLVAALDEPLEVDRGNIVALTVPTWAPAFGVNLPRNNWWRSSRRRGDCDNVSQRAAQQFQGSLRMYGCTYFRARLLYTATYIPDPRPTTD